MSDGGIEPTDPAFLLTDGQLNPDFEVQLLTSHLSSGAVTCQAIQITEFENKLLVALPHSMWHRQVAQRLIVSGGFSRPTLVEVMVADLYSPMVQEENIKMKVWVGYLHRDLAQDLQPYSAVAVCNHYFMREEGRVLIPFPDSLIAAANEHFAFFSAQEEEPLPHVDGEDEAPLAELIPQKNTPDGRDGQPVQEPASGSVAIERRVQNIESVMDAMQTTLQQIASKVGSTPKTVATKPKAPAKAAANQSKPLALSCQAPSKTVNSYPHLDPAVVQAALQAGVTHENLVQMEKVVLNNARARKTADPNKNLELDPLSEDENDNQVIAVENEELVEGSGSAQDPMMQSLTKLTNIMSMLTEDKARKTARSKLDAALDSLQATGSDSTALGAGKKTAAARRALRNAFLDHPEEIHMLVEKLMFEDLNSQTLAPGCQPRGLSARAWVEFRSRIGSYKGSAYVWTR